MLSTTSRRRLFTAVATTVTLAATAPTASAMPIHDVGFPTDPERLQVVSVQADQGVDWAAAGFGAGGMLALVLVAAGGARVLSPLPSRGRTAVRS